MNEHNTQTARERLAELWDLKRDWTQGEQAEYDRLATIVRAQNEKIWAGKTQQQGDQT